MVFTTAIASCLYSPVKFYAPGVRLTHLRSLIMLSCLRLKSHTFANTAGMFFSIASVVFNYYHT